MGSSRNNQPAICNRARALAHYFSFFFGFLRSRSIFLVVVYAEKRDDAIQ